MAKSQWANNSESLGRYIAAGLISRQKEAIKGVCFVIVGFTMTLNDIKFFPPGEGIFKIYQIVTLVQSTFDICWLEAFSNNKNMPKRCGCN